MTEPAIKSLFLSRLFLDLHSRQVRSELAHPYEMHRTLLRAFPRAPATETEKAREKYGVLFRADVEEDCQQVLLYVQSFLEPDWSEIEALDRYLLGAAEPAKNIGLAHQNLAEGQVLAFRLRANPTKRVFKVNENEPDLKGKRVGLWREEEQIAWLIRKGRQGEKGKPGGFEIVTEEVQYRNGESHLVPRVNVCHEGKSSGEKTADGRMTHLSVCFDGVLKITDANGFREALRYGIGPGKAFGFGLLSVARVE